jgi:catechol 2,3-dioxygenase-like lactoylglutathione lyase family enzyme
VSFGVTLLGSKRQSETRGSRVGSFNGGRSSFCFNLERRMIDHIGISVGSIARATEFYLKALAPLGYGIVMEVSAEETGHGAAIAFGAPGQAADFQSGKPSVWVGESAKASGPLHVAFVAPSRAAVDVFYHAAIAAGGADNGAPGLRPQYHAAYYAAFVLDPDGNNIEAVCHGPE